MVMTWGKERGEAYEVCRLHIEARSLWRMQGTGGQGAHRGLHRGAHRGAGEQHGVA